jgi:putative peptidoglycan lipid II flippase
VEAETSGDDVVGVQREGPDGAAPISILRSSGIVALGTAMSRATGFLRLFATGYAIGFTALTDTYTLANTTPNIVYELLLGGVLSATLVPIFVHHAEEEDDEGTSAVISVAVAALVAFMVVGIVAAPQIVRLYTLTASGEVAAEQREVATSLLRLFMPQMVFYGLTAMGTALLNARRRFAAPAFAPVVNNLVVTAMLFALPHVAGRTPSLEDVRTDTGLLLLLGVGTTAGIVAMTLLLWPAIKRSGFRFRWRLDFGHPAVRQVGRLSTWTIGYVVANQAALLLVLLLANRRVGGVSSYTAAYIFFLLPHALVAVSLMTTTVPELASAAARRNWDRYRERFSTGVRLTALIILPAATGYLVLGRPIVRALLEYGALSTEPDAATTTGDNLSMFGIGLLGFSIYLFTLRGFYALRDTKTPFILNVGENVLNVLLALALEPLLGVPGLALAYALSYTVAAVVAVAMLRRRVGSLEAGRILRSLVRITAACVVMAAAVGAVRLVLGGNPVLETAVGVSLGAAVFVVAVVALRVEEVSALRVRFLARA